MPIYITVDPDSPASIVYHDHSYFIRHESTDNTQRRKSSIPINTTQSQVQEKASLPSVQVLNQLLFDHQQKTKNSQSDSSTSTNPIDFTAILRALLVKQGHHLPSKEPQINDSTPSSTAAL
jgi:hypothetical protein